jgi:2-C-methyl-D-erythritol 4-phosphate cytidylyltransferase
LSDTVKQVDGRGVVAGTPERSRLRAVQTPQLFRLGSLEDAHRRGRQLSSPATDDARLLEMLGYDVAVFPGDRRNFKITDPLDLEIARCLLDKGLA